MNIIKKYGKDDLATVYIGETEKGRIEFVESLQPPFNREDKWVVIVSTLYGCPVACTMCDAGGTYKGPLTTDEILAQIDHVITSRYPNRNVPTKKLKIQFARMGEPALNDNVLRILRLLPNRYNAPGLTPSISTVAPDGRENFFDELIKIKNDLYQNNFQLQFSIHTTDEKLRDKIIPVKKWDLEKIAVYGKRFFNKSKKKITLNFILAKQFSIDPKIISYFFSPEMFFIKMTPLNPTCRAKAKKLRSALDISNTAQEPQIVTELRDAGFEVLLSIGEVEENLIGSNCGQYIKTYEDEIKSPLAFKNGYRLSNYLRS